MTKLALFEKMMSIAKANGYSGPDYNFRTGFIVDGENINCLIFRKDFSNALWGEDVAFYNRKGLSNCRDKWEYLSNIVK